MRRGFIREGAEWHGADQCWVPLYEAKMIHQLDHRWAGYAENGSDSADFGSDEKVDPSFEPVPRYWVPEREVTDRLASKGWRQKWLMGWRDITNATNERTVIATVFPYSAVSNKLPLFLPDQPARKIAALAANLSAISFDFAARQKVGGTTLNFFILFQFPVLAPDFYTESRLAFVTPKVLETHLHLAQPRPLRPRSGP